KEIIKDIVLFCGGDPNLKDKFMCNYRLQCFILFNFQQLWVAYVIARRHFSGDEAIHFWLLSYGKAI
ncbi:MAG: hypothetical protein LBH67_01930, partial [Rickettsia sp.]|nr:hypothetical protein [Rickettsia sp.]